MCVALSQEILNQAGEHNNLNLRPFASIASKILDMTAKAKASNPGLESQALFDAFDVDAFMASSGPLGPEPPPAADPAAASCRSLAEGGEAAKEPEAAKEDEEDDDTYVAPVRDPRNITFQTRILNPHLVCTLCMGYFNDACTTARSKPPLWQRPSSALVPPPGAPGGSGRLGTARKRPAHWTPSHCLVNRDALLKIPRFCQPRPRAVLHARPADSGSLLRLVLRPLRCFSSSSSHNVRGPRHQG